MLAYNIPGVTNLVLTRQQIVGIYNGSLNNWNDPTFFEYNRGVDLPNATIVPVARYDASGSTEMFTASLSSFSEPWRASYGVFNNQTGWNSTVVKVFGQRTSGMADYIKRYPYSIGYLAPTGAVEVKLPYAAVVNQQGNITTANNRAIQAAMNERSQNMSSRLTSTLVDCQGEETYPIAGYSYFIVHMTQVGNCSIAIELARYIEWCLTSPQANAEVENYLMVPVSQDIANRILSSVLQRMTCNGQPLMNLVDHQRYIEEESLKTWKLPLTVVSPLLAVVILCLVAYSIRQRVQYIQMLNRDDWKIEHVIPKKRRTIHNEEAATDKTRVYLLPSSEKGPGSWNVHEVVTRPLSIAPVFKVNRRVKETLMRLKNEIRHENIATFFGITPQHDSLCLVELYCANGTLVNFLRGKSYIVNQLRYVVCADIASGMAYLHGQEIIHGNLSIDKCHVDSRWTIKIIDWEYAAMYDVLRKTDRSRSQTTREQSVLHFLFGSSASSQDFRHLAPEVQKNGLLYEPTRAGDVYSFGIIMRDLFVGVTGHDQQPTSSAVSDIPVKAHHIIEMACHKVLIRRPTFEQLEKNVRSAISGGKKNFLDRYVDCNIATSVLSLCFYCNMFFFI